MHEDTSSEPYAAKMVAAAANYDPNLISTTLPNDINSSNDLTRPPADDELADDPNLIAYNEENVEFISLDKGNRGSDAKEIPTATAPRILVNVSIATDTGKGTQHHALYQLYVEVPATVDFPNVTVTPIQMAAAAVPVPEQVPTPPPASLTLINPFFVDDIDDQVTESSPILCQDTAGEFSSTPSNGDADADYENEVDDVITTSATEVATPISLETNASACANQTIPYVLVLEGEHTYTLSKP